ncbi:MAG TPA: sulfite exporter TauE/SafE family protein [Opitutaceae bacterium]|nr:sulfite exporter TauE/SafE family protein [Opitutaceae bacterium]
MELAAVNSPAAAFAAGLVVSLHCAGMCGPLACALLPVRGEHGDSRTVATAYHLMRLAGYTVMGGLAGGLGMLPLSWMSASALRWLPWAMVLFFVAMALRLDRFLPRSRAVAGWLLRLNAGRRGRSRVAAAGIMGLATPLLPCGPLYFLIALALLTGSALRGMEFMLAFGLGTVPLLWVAQMQFDWLRTRLTPRGLAVLRVTLALITALVIAWRLRSTLGFAGPSTQNFICL